MVFLLDAFCWGPATRANTLFPDQNGMPFRGILLQVGIPATEGRVALEKIICGVDVCVVEGRGNRANYLLDSRTMGK